MILLFTLTLCCSAVVGMVLDEKGHEVLGGLCAVIFISCLIIVGFAASVSLIINTSADGTLAKYQKTRESLVYQLENNLYDNDNDLGKKELYDQITEYNKDIATGRANHNNFWLKPFYSDIYDDLEPIELGGE